MGVYKDRYGTQISSSSLLFQADKHIKLLSGSRSSTSANMLTPLFSLSSILLLQCLTSAVVGVPIAQDEDDFPDRDFPPFIEDPQPPSRPCDAQGCRDPTYGLLQDEIFPGQNIFVITFGRPGRVQSSPGQNISTILTSYVEDGLPYFLKQLNPTPKDIPALVTEGAPLIVGAVLDFAEAKDVSNSQKLKAWAEKAYVKAPCDLFAAATLPVLEPALDAVYFDNNPNQDLEYGQKPTTTDLDYFIQPVFGPISHRDGITIYYNSKFPTFQNGIWVANQARDVFVRGPDVSHYRSTPTSPGNRQFKYLVLALMRHFGTLTQWSAVDYLDNEFDIQSLLGLCKVGPRTLFLEEDVQFDFVTNLNLTGWLQI